MTRILLLASFLAACSEGRVLRRDTPPNLGSKDGVVVFAGDASAEIIFTLCKDELRCVSGRIAQDETVSAVVVEEGRYCLTDVLLERQGAGAILHSMKPTDPACFKVTPLAVHYFGHLDIEARAIGNSAWSTTRMRFVRRDDAIRGQVRTALPHLAPMDLVTHALEPPAGYPDD